MVFKGTIAITVLLSIMQNNFYVKIRLFELILYLSYDIYSILLSICDSYHLSSYNCAIVSV